MLATFLGTHLMRSLSSLVSQQAQFLYLGLACVPRQGTEQGTGQNFLP